MRVRTGFPRGAWEPDERLTGPGQKKTLVSAAFPGFFQFLPERHPICSRCCYTLSSLISSRSADLRNIGLRGNTPREQGTLLMNRCEIREPWACAGSYGIIRQLPEAYSLTINVPGIMPMWQLQLMIPDASGVNSTTCSP